ncbi:MAG TPA: hypothetical protein VD908_21160 [Cytophagales bacterium]|nr:hypothetical protein [Cytophagales bacterium]
MKRKYLIWIAVAAIVVWLIIDAVNQPGVKDLKGNMEEVASYRNENNTGPVIRIYAVTIEDTLWREMEQYGQYMLHTKYGNTKVFFFLQGSPVPEEISPGKKNFNEALNKFCIAKYEKDAMGRDSFWKYPFK